METMWTQLSREISKAVAQAGQSIVAVDGRAGHTSSGIVWRSDLVLTAAHSLRHDANAAVITGSGPSIPARVLGRDRGTDIALLKLEQKIDNPSAQFGATTSLSIGELTVAIARTRRGNLVASSGIISGLMGEWQAARTRIDQFIRPDLNLYPGFSGGALIGSGAGVLGMNTSGLLRGKPITIPASTLEKVAEAIEARGHVAQPYIGLVMQPVALPDSLQLKAGAAVPTGLLVMHVEAGGPADAGGVLLGDILLSMDGGLFDDLDDIHEGLRNKTVGQEVQIALLRGGEKFQLAIRVGERPAR